MGNQQLRASDVMSWVAEHDLDAFTVDDVVHELRSPRAVARGLLARMAAANQVFRLKRGMYLPLPANYWRRPGTPLIADWYVVAKHLARPDDYFLGYYTAMEHHRMTQHPLTTLFVATTVQKDEVIAGLVTFRFVTLTERKFRFGHEAVQLRRGKTVEIADLDRTFLDCCDRLDLCGGIEEVVRGFARRHGDLDRERLTRYVLELDRPVTTKRLGYLLEIAGHGDPRLMRELERLAGRIGNYARLLPEEAEIVERSRRWELDINVDPERLIEATIT